MGLYSNNFETARFEGTKNPRHTLRCRQKNSLHYTNFCKIISISINKLAILKLQGLCCMARKHFRSQKLL